MTVVSALCMLPAGVIFPALVRAANTPPPSQTLERGVRKETTEGLNDGLYKELMLKQTERDADFQAGLHEGESGSYV